MTDKNNFVYLVMQHDSSMGKEWVMYAYDTFGEAEDIAKKHNDELGRVEFPRFFVKAIRYFKKGVL